MAGIMPPGLRGDNYEFPALMRRIATSKAFRAVSAARQLRRNRRCAIAIGGHDGELDETQRF